jgi:hypothetical protein
MTKTDHNGGGVAPAPPSQKRGGGSGSGAGASAGRSSGMGGGLSGGAHGDTSGDAFGHHSIRDIARGKGHSAVKSAAYITGEALYDSRVGLTFGRAEKAGRVLASGTVGPKGQQWTPSDLWGAAEKAETKSNARTAQERVLALPEELKEAAHKRLLNGYALWMRDEYGVAATWALHAPNDKGDGRNVHGHILTTTRAVGLDAEGRPEFGAKVRALSGDREQVAAEVEKQRKEWAKRVNAELERAGSPRRLDHRSHDRRAETGDGPKGLEPGKHRGPKEDAIQRKRGQNSTPTPRRTQDEIRAFARAHEREGDRLEWSSAKAAERAMDREIARAAREDARRGPGVLADLGRSALDSAEQLGGGDKSKRHEEEAVMRWNLKQARAAEAWRKKQAREEEEGDGGTSR